MTKPSAATRQGTDHRAALVGTVLAAAPLFLGLVAALMAFAGRFGGPGNSPTAFWYVAAATAPAALVGAGLLLLAHRHDRALRVIATWAAVAAGGWTFGLGSAQVDGLANGPESVAQSWEYVLLGLGVAVYLVGLVGLVVTGWRSRSPSSPSRGVRKRRSRR
jgi:hypothetical protein